jgi:hypothetical protein
MKTNNNNQKKTLKLNKTTIMKLNDEMLIRIEGGVTSYCLTNDCHTIVNTIDLTDCKPSDTCPPTLNRNLCKPIV